MKEKIGLITFYSENFGSILQCYATKFIIENHGYICDVLAERIETQLDNGIKHKARRLIFVIHNSLKSPRFFLRWYRSRGKPAPLSIKTLDKMNGFVSEELSPIICELGKLKEISDNYRAFVVGSDQVWNANNNILDSFFLKFSPDNKKIAFAISFGTDCPSECFLNVIENGISGFSHISVREESGQKIIKKVSDIPTKRIADPTVMLTKADWIEFCKDAKICEQEFVLVHFLNNPSKIAIEFIKNFVGCKKVICIAYRYDVFEEIGWEYRDCDPREYVKYINLANMVFTDSFHTTMFSVNLGKRFYTFEREYLHAHPQSNRIIEMLSRYGLNNRYISSVNQDIDENITIYDDILENERKEAIEYLIERIADCHE